MPMVTRVRNALRRLIEDYGSSDEDKQEQRRPSLKGASKKSPKVPKSQRSKIFFRPSGPVFVEKAPASDENGGTSSGSSSVSSTEEDGVQAGGDAEPASNLQGLLGTDHPTDETPSLDVRTADDRSDSERTRAFPHFPGNWATFVHLIPRIDALIPFFDQLLYEISTVADIKATKWTMVEEPHVSLSRTVALRYHEIPRFTANLKSEINKTSLPRFSYAFEDVEIYGNDEANTSFLALKVGQGCSEMCSLVKIVDNCLKAFNMPTFYEKPEFHMSFAWCADSLSESDKRKILDTLRDKLVELEEQYGDDLFQFAKAVHCRSGNRSYLMPL